MLNQKSSSIVAALATRVSSLETKTDKLYPAFVAAKNAPVETPKTKSAITRYKNAYKQMLDASHTYWVALKRVQGVKTAWELKI
jgi:hypothetical protein